MEKTIIVLQGTANVGKSTTLAKLGRIMLAKGATSTSNIVNEPDYHAFFNYHNVVIGLRTYGDTEEIVKDALEKFKGKCDIIIIASKRYGATVNVIKQFAKDNSFRTFWSAPHWREGNKDQIDQLKEYAAHHYDKMVVDIIQGNL